jgi:hypothetical protein
MLATDIKIHGRYGAKIGGSHGAKLVNVKIIAIHPQGGWLATNLETRRTIRIRSAARLIVDLDVVEAQQEKYDRARAFAARLIAEAKNPK